MRNSMILTLILGTTMLACATPRAGERPIHTTSAPAPTTEVAADVHDFDFLNGDWTGTNRRLKARGVGSNDWDEFPGNAHAASHLGGVAQVEEVAFPTKGWSGLTFRVFDVQKREWSIYWINSKTGAVFPPVVGRFHGDRGEFFGDDQDDGHPVKVRFTWTKLGGGRSRWEQAFSIDGHTWETNWVNDVRQVQPAP